MRAGEASGAVAGGAEHGVEHGHYTAFSVRAGDVHGRVGGMGISGLGEEMGDTAQP